MPLFPSRMPAKRSPRSDFIPVDFRRLIAEKGLWVTWQQCAQCPCQRVLQQMTTDNGFPAPLDNMYATGEPTPECVLCKGRGFYSDPNSDQLIQINLSSMQSYGKQFTPMGDYAAGTARATMFPEHKASVGDRFTLRDSAILVRENRQRLGTVENLRFPVTTQNLQLSTSPNDTPTSVLYAQRASLLGVSLVIDKMVLGVDFVVTNTGAIDWSLGIANGHAPALNAEYTISYYAKPRYVMTDYIHAVRDTWDGERRPANDPKFAPMPLQVILKAEYLGNNAAMV